VGVLLFIGPEGGFSDAERTRLATTAQGWRLGGHVLRAETAAIVGDHGPRDVGDFRGT
jgi:RsmE family RNA methyltransferase